MNAPRANPRWPRWKIWLAYGVLAAIALLSVWSIDGHVLKIAEEWARRSAGR